MKKSALLYALAVVLFFVLGFWSFDSVHKEMQQYSMLTSRSIRVSEDFRELQRQVTNAAIANPGLLQEAHADIRGELFFTDSLMIVKQLESLKGDVLDTVNAGIAKQLDTLVKAEMPWLLRSNVPDSITHHRAQEHIAVLRSINSLINKGITRTTFLFRYREQKLDTVVAGLKTRFMIFLGLACALVAYSTFSFFRQYAKRHRKEEELERQEKRFRSMVEHSQDLIVIVDENRKVLYRSPAAERITGFTNEEREKNPNLDSVHPDDAEQIRNHLANMRSDPGKVIPVSYRAKHKQGHYIWLEGTFTSLFHHTGLNGMVINLRDVSKQKEAEQELMKSEKRFRQTLEHMMEGVQIIGFDWRYIYVNDALTTYSTYKRDEMLGRSIQELYPGVEQTPLYASLKKCMEDRQSSQLESEFVFPNGTKKYFELSIQPAPEGIFILSVDVSERKAAEEQLARSERRFRALIEKSTDLKTLISSTGLFTYASPSVSNIFGYTEEEFLDKPAYDFFHPDDVQDLLRKRTEILDTPGSSFDFQYRARHKKGGWIWCEGTLTNMLHEPYINAMVSNFRDISHVKKSEEQKEFNRKNLDALINNTNDLLWSIDKDLRLITFNQPFLEVIKMATGKELNKGDNVLSAALSEEREKRFRTFYKRALTGEMFTAIDIVEGPVGYAAEISFYPIRKGDEIIGTACYSRDVSLRIKQEKEREKMIADLMRYSKNLEQFAYVVSHNLRAPVANIMGLSNLMTGSISDSDKALSQQYMLKAVNQLDVIVRDLNKILEVRAVVGQNTEEVNLNEIVQGIQDSIHETIKNERVYIELDLKTTLVKSVKSYIYSIFYNLITNSIKYKHDERSPLIRISSTVSDGRTMILFKDNGMGMNLEEYGEKVFGLYQRFHLHVSGKGMGLFMVRTQVEALEGTIVVKSSPGQGSEFIIELPSEK